MLVEFLNLPTGLAVGLGVKDSPSKMDSPQYVVGPPPKRASDLGASWLGNQSAAF
jgi:hypothetical protein